METEYNWKYLKYFQMLNAKSLALFIAAFLLMLLFRKEVFTILLVLFMIAAACVLPLYKRIIFISLGIELTTFCAVVFAFAFGPLVAAVCTLIIVAISSFLSWGLDQAMLPKMGVYIMIALLASVVSSFDISLVGKIMTILMNLAFMVIYYFIYGPTSFITGAPSIIINIILNFILFSRYAGPMLELLQ